jgi:hypothetical protein
MFGSSKDPIPLLEKRRVYRLECSDCSVVYIGQIGRKLKYQVTEHEKVLQNPIPERFNFAADSAHFSHSFSKNTELHLAA